MRSKVGGYCRLADHFQIKDFLNHHDHNLLKEMRRVKKVVSVRSEEMSG